MTTPTPIPPHTELRIRQCGEAVWNATCAHDPDVAPKKEFTEGHYIAFAAGMLVNAETARFYEAKLKEQQRELELTRWECSGLWIALAVAVVAWVLSR
jgi:hypothetical protein